MKTIELLKTHLSIEQLIELARRENVLIKVPNGDKFILAEVDDFESEVESLRYNDEFIAFLDSRAKEPKILIEDAKKRLLLQD